MRRAFDQTTTLLPLLALLLLLLGGAEGQCLDCLFNCCDDLGNSVYASSNPTCVANGDPTCPSECWNVGPGCALDTTPITVGVRFVTSKDICIFGIQFYNADASQTFTTSLWDRSTNSSLLPTFPTATSGFGGWYTTNFDYVPMSPGAEYVAAYSAPLGRYAYEYYAFNSDVKKGPVTFKRGVNGVYRYNALNAYPGESPFRNSSYLVTPLWVPDRQYVVWNATSDAPMGEILDGFVGCIYPPYNIEVAFNCQTVPWVSFKLSNLNTKIVVTRSNETEYPYFLWGNLGANVLPNRKPLPNAMYQLTTTIGNKSEAINFTQSCPP